MTSSTNTAITANDYVTYTGGTLTWDSGNNKVTSPTGDFFVKTVTLTDTDNTYKLSQSDLITMTNFDLASFTEGTFSMSNVGGLSFEATGANVQT